MMNSPNAERLRAHNQEVLEHGRQVQEFCRNVDRLIALNNRRIARGLKPFAFPTPMIAAGRALIAKGWQ